MKQFPILLLAAAILLSPRPGGAHDHWINDGAYKDPRTGIHCCGPNDCFRFEDADIELRDDGVFVRSLQELVPYNEVQVGEDEHWWRCQKTDGTRRCFFMPRLGS